MTIEKPAASTETERFDRILAEIMDENPASHLLSIAGVYEAVSEEFNNEILERMQVEDAKETDEDEDET